MNELRYASFLMGAEFPENREENIRLCLSEISGEAGHARGNSMEGPRIRVRMGSGKSTCAVHAVGIVFCAHIALKPPSERA